MKQIVIVILIFTLFSCGGQRQLQKIYLGKPQSALDEKFGKPKTVLDHGSEKVFIYEKAEELRSTEIKQGKLTLDPVVSPKVKKTERYYFTVKDEKVIKVKLEEEYER